MFHYLVEDIMNVQYYFPGGKPKALTMSYDDGSTADKRLVSVFNQYGIKGTFNLNYGLMNEYPANRVQKQEVYKLYKGHEVATHASHHPVFARCHLPYVTEEIIEDRKGLESLTGYTVRGHAYPYSSYSREIKELIKHLGIAYGRVTSCNLDFELPADPMEWHPTCHHKHPKLMEYGRVFVGDDKLQYKLMYVWGHSSEFDKNDNWYQIEEFCSFMGGRKDIWYATNIEIIDYMNVIQRLQFNVSCTAIYNPSASSAWLKAGNGRIVEVRGGNFLVFE